MGQPKLSMIHEMFQYDCIGYLDRHVTTLIWKTCRYYNMKSNLIMKCRNHWIRLFVTVLERIQKITCGAFLNDTCP